MTSAGYGNHTPANDADAKSDPAGKKPAAGGDLSVAETQGEAEPGAAPSPSEERSEATPGAGVLPDGSQGDEVDPGAG